MKGHERYHKLNPADLGLKAVMPLQVSRTTAETGEQFTIEVPIYPDDSREMLNDRVNFALSIMQDRLEDVNKAVVEARVKAQKAQAAKIMAAKVRALEKKKSRGKITEEQYQKELDELNAQFGDATESIDLENKSDDEALAGEAEGKSQVAEA